MRVLLSKALAGRLRNMIAREPVMSMRLPNEGGHDPISVDKTTQIVPTL
jgi:hypothetical protein